MSNEYFVGLRRIYCVKYASDETIYVCSIWAFVYLARGLTVQVEDMSDLVFAGGADLVDLVAQDDNGTLGELLVAEKWLQLVYGLGEALAIPHVNEEDDGVNRRKIVLPHATNFKKEMKQINFFLTWTWNLD